MKHYITRYLFLLTAISGVSYGISLIPGVPPPTEGEWIGIGAVVIVISALAAIDDKDKGCGTAA